MARMNTVIETASSWGISGRRITTLCREGRIPGAVKEGKTWLIPGSAEKPSDGRVKNGRYVKAKRRPKLLPDVTHSNFKEFCSDKAYYVDKTEFIKDLIDMGPSMYLFTRPRRFGKSMNMSMLQTFFEKTGSDTSVLFRDKRIWRAGKRYRDMQGRYPVISVNLNPVEGPTMAHVEAQIRGIIYQAYMDHPELDDPRWPLWRDVTEYRFPEDMYWILLGRLAKMLHECHGVSPMLFIDEYDKPSQCGYKYGFYEEAVSLSRNMLASVLKDQKYISWAFLSGVTVLAKSSLFSGVNNIEVISVRDRRFAEYFGFTSEDVRRMCDYWEKPEKYDEIVRWYDGYRFGGLEIFNPYSIMKYFRMDCSPRYWWTESGEDSIIRNDLDLADVRTAEKIETLLDGGCITERVDFDMVYPDLGDRPDSIWSLLLIAGYLTIENVVNELLSIYELRFANEEVKTFFRRIILEKMGRDSEANYSSFTEALEEADTGAIEKRLHDILLNSASFLDMSSEAFYHGMLLGMTAVMDDWKVRSNRESGSGRYDIACYPRRKGKSGIILELKRCSDPEKLPALSAEALQQTYDREYDTDLVYDGVSKVIRYGIAFSGSQVRVVKG